MITPIARFSLATAGIDEAETKRLLFDGRPVGKVSCSHIEHQFAVGPDAYLLFTTYGSPFEETLVITHLSGDFRVLQRKMLGGDYTPGILSAVELKPPDAICFRFPSRQLWRLEIGLESSGAHAGFSLCQVEA